MLRYSLLMLSATGLLLASGCATSSDYVEATDTTVAVKNVDRMSSSDWVVITQEAGQALLNSPLFDEYLAAYKIDAEQTILDAAQAGKPLTTREKLNVRKPLLMLSTIQNNTSEHIDSRLLTERLREILFNSGKVRFTSYAAGEGQSIDGATAAVRTLQHDPNVNQSTVAKKGKVNAYDLSLSGSIIKQSAQAGRDREISYTFSLILTDNVTGEGVWAYTREIKRQNRQGIFGY
ncbi:MAG: hypothetical protein IJC73_03300 [Lentisphaeria bacterium]|nr:hypothetical protein [Lentisphaeria bacterium]